MVLKEMETNMKLPCLVFDIGATKMRFSVSKDGKDLEELLVLSTPQKFSQALEEFKKVREKVDLKKLGVVVGGVAGPLDTKKAKIINAPNLPDWNGKELKNKMEDIFGTEVYLENDSALVGLGEATAGAGKDFDIVCYITISTGINGVKVVDKKIVKNAYGFEIGKQIIDFDDSYDGKTLEEIVSGGAVQERFGKHPKKIKDDKFWDKVTEIFSYGIYNSILHWSPEVVVLGGGMVKNINVEKVKREIEKLPRVFEEWPEVKEAELGEAGGLQGALKYLKEI